MLLIGDAKCLKGREDNFYISPFVCTTHYILTKIPLQNCSILSYFFVCWRSKFIHFHNKVQLRAPYEKEKEKENRKNE